MLSSGIDDKILKVTVNKSIVEKIKNGIKILNLQCNMLVLSILITVGKILNINTIKKLYDT